MQLRIVGLNELRRLGATDDWIAQHGGTLTGDDVVFEAGEMYDAVQRLLELPAMPKVEFPQPGAGTSCSERMKPLGPPLWEKLHRGAWTVELTPHGVMLLIDSITRAMPCGSCKSHWLDMIAQYRPTDPKVLASHYAFFAWTVDRHDQVNLRIQKPSFGLAQALVKYPPPPPSSSVGGARVGSTQGPQQHTSSEGSA